MTQSVTQNDVLAKVAIDGGLSVSLALPYVGVVVEDGSELVAAFAFNNWDRHSVDCTAIVLKPLAISAARDIAYYIFVTLGAKRVTCMTLATNFRAVSRLSRLGFEFEGTMRERFPQGDALMFGLLASSPTALRLTRGFHPLPPRSDSDRRRADPIESADGSIPAVA